MIGLQRLVNRWITNLSKAAERFAKPDAVRTARMVGILPTAVRKYEPRVTRGLIQGLSGFTLSLRIVPFVICDIQQITHCKGMTHQENDH
ncbi:hypothetical protein AVEN_173862-1 [Araneus ventricosus]|uniref:Uncharacterized protein n=1 Tax=Araneus ventricosus TaxID=182803 RepID=A0A4Y2I176_ARAVE|nr:hypothetical protein AVEN_173862-1 [Araneus ventricosus]